MLGVTDNIAQQIVATREQLDGYTSIDDAVVYAAGDRTVEDAIREHGIILPR